MKIESVVLFCFAALLAGCSATPGKPLSTTAETPPASRFDAGRAGAIAAAVRPDGTADGGEFVGETLYVYLSNFHFDPDVLHLKSGTVTRIHLNNIAWVTHYFGGESFFRNGAEVVNLLGSDIPTRQHHIPVAPFSSRDLYLYIKEPGEYPLSCFVPSHRVEGMTGTLVVDP